MGWAGVGLRSDRTVGRQIHFSMWCGRAPRSQRFPRADAPDAPPARPQIACLTGVVEAKLSNALAQGRPASFDEWILRVMGKGIADLFMRPYNFKARVPVEQGGLACGEACTGVAGLSTVPPGGAGNWGEASCLCGKRRSGCRPVELS